MTNENEITEDRNTSGTDYFWLLSCFLVTAVAAFLRFYQLGLKPMHHDEGVNGFFLTTLFREGIYKYDPSNYHGPTLYYISLAFAKVFGLETIPVRASVAVFGVLTVVLALYLRPYIGKAGSLFTALFIALSPGMVYISRYFIHEIFFIFLSLAFVLSILLFLDNRKAGVFSVVLMFLVLFVTFLPPLLNLAAVIGGENAPTVWMFRVAFVVVEIALIFFVMQMLRAWDTGRPIYLLLASASASLMFATKETAFITLGTMLIACICVWIWQRIRKSPESVSDEQSGENLTWLNFRLAIGSGPDLLLLLAAVAAVFIYIGVSLFSSFFTYLEGVGKAFEAYTVWTKTGSKDHTQNGMWAYFGWGMRAEAPIFILSAVGLLIAFIKARHRFAMFAGLWAFGLLAAYTLIPYKTPWLALSFLLPMCVIAGYAINELVKLGDIRLKLIGYLLAISGAAILAYQSYMLNFVHYDDNDRTYVYAHTKREFLDLMAEIDRYAAKSGKGNESAIDVVSPDYWPMVWYVKDYPKAIFHGKMIASSTAEMIVAKQNEQENEAIRKFAANYEFAGNYPLRPGVELMLLVRKDLADGGAQQLYKIDPK